MRNRVLASLVGVWAAYKQKLTSQFQRIQRWVQKNPSVNSNNRVMDKKITPNWSELYKRLTPAEFARLQLREHFRILPKLDDDHEDMRIFREYAEHEYRAQKAALDVLIANNAPALNLHLTKISLAFVASAMMTWGAIEAIPIAAACIEETPLNARRFLRGVFLRLVPIPDEYPNDVGKMVQWVETNLAYLHWSEMDGRFTVYG
ncbi:MAG: hypothetical protein KF716_19245 [Anaerolineae bacterium]|nr:hypothetical protein [Anaerolineae bacterium]